MQGGYFMIHVAFGFNDKKGTYSKFVGTTMLSLFENTNEEVTVHILHDNTLTDDNHDKFIYLAGRYSQAVKFYNVEKLCAEKIEKFLSLAPEVEGWRLTRGAFYRLLIPQIFPMEIEKCIYLDSDIIVNLDIKELWQIELGEKILAAVPEILFYGSVNEMNNGFRLCKDGLVKHEDYFNSGVLLMNLKLLRGEEKNIIDAFYFRAQNPQYRDYFDQNVLNYCFSTKTLKLPIKFNKPTKIVRLEKEPLTKKIYHYAGGSFGIGLGLDMKDALNRLWMKYFVKTPWFNEKTIGQLYEGFMQVQNDLKKSALNISAAMKIKSRAFITVESKLNKVIENFSVREGEEVFIMTDNTPAENLINTIKNSREEKIFFLFLPNFPLNLLEENGLVRGEDFFNGFDFFLNEYNSYPLAKAM